MLYVNNLSQMTGSFKRQEHTVKKQEIDIQCEDRVQNQKNLVVMSEYVVPCVQMK